MRVISGCARGLRLKSPLGLDTRPTIDRIKESLFNIIANDLCDIDFLDLYSGSGSIGIEALSRGAKKSVFVDFSEESVGVINENLRFTRLIEKAEVLKSEVSDAVFRFGREKRKFDIIFMDPPYKKGLVEVTLKAVFDADILAENGFIIAEQAARENDILADGFNVFRIKNYNKIKMTFIERL